jgi:peptidoglycan/LPS O-acetylase OafA/YrhL
MSVPSIGTPSASTRAGKAEWSDAKVAYQPALDSIRGVGFVVVMVVHAQKFVGVDPGHLPGGSIALDVFFVLSGFLITSLLLREWSDRSTISFRNFYTRRALRLLPAFFVLLITISLAAALGAPLDITPAWVLSTLFYVANWGAAWSYLKPSALNHTWSLSVEEQFYLCWPLVLYAMLRMKLRPRTIVILLGLGLVAVFVERIVLLRVFHPTGARMYFGTDTRSDGLWIGCMVGVLARARMLPTAGAGLAIVRTLAALSAGFLVWVVVRGLGLLEFTYYGGLTASVIATGFVVAGLQAPVIKPVRAVVEAKPLVWMGRLSYSLYLWHFPIFRLAALADLPWPLYALVGTGLTFGAGAISHYFIEKPFLDLKQRFAVK